MTATQRVWLGTLAFAVIYTVLGAIRYANYHAGSDLGLFTQSIATAFSTFANTPEGGNHFTYHFSPILLACAPLVLATHSPLALVALQAIAGGLVAPPLFFIAQKRVGDGRALAVAAVALLYPPLAGLTFADFHENGFAPAATLWLLWAVDAGRLRRAAFFVVVALSIKEDQAVLLAAAGVFGALAKLQHITQYQRHAESIAHHRTAAECQADGKAGFVDPVQGAPQAIGHGHHAPAMPGAQQQLAFAERRAVVVVAREHRSFLRPGNLAAAGEIGGRAVETEEARRQIL